MCYTMINVSVSVCDVCVCVCCVCMCVCGRVCVCVAAVQVKIQPSMHEQAGVVSTGESIMPLRVIDRDSYMPIGTND